MMTPPPTTAALPDLTGLRVLVADDNRDVADTTADLLELAGAAVTVAYGGPDGLAAALARRPDVCVLDLSMPAVDGFEVGAAVREVLGPGPLLVAVSALGDTPTLDRLTEGGFDHHFTKPVPPADLLSAVADAVGRGPGRPG